MGVRRPYQPIKSEGVFCSGWGKGLEFLADVSEYFGFEFILNKAIVLNLVDSPEAEAG